MTCPDIFYAGKKLAQCQCPQEADCRPWVVKATSTDAKIWRDVNKRVSDKCKPCSPRRGDSEKRMRYCISRCNARKTRALNTWHGRKTTCGDDPEVYLGLLAAPVMPDWLFLSVGTTTSKGSNKPRLSWLYQIGGWMTCSPCLSALTSSTTSPKRVHGIEVLHIRQNQRFV
ncbi:hypothetical protein CK203_116541 [Vitis vinifera]|uniref:Uncharacterized protein n=1 Tax=Vitis vinifera TaxID=29760 RepID=A0A438EAA0_VITVI|nr:hypothetical protein CK203_116541 [Vitis vinifera]